MPAPEARRIDTVLVALLLIALPLGTAPLEIATGLCVAGALATPHRRSAWTHPLALPTLALAGVWLAMIPASGNVHEGLGHVWPLAPLLALPALRPDPRVREVGLIAAGVAAIWAVAQAAAGGEGHGGFSHHLSLAYALLPPLGVAAACRRWALAAAIALGVAATGSLGALPAALVTVVAALTGFPMAAWLGGAAGTVGLLVVASPSEVAQRAVLWTGGLGLLGHPTGPGDYPRASALVYNQLDPGFWFPNHAHDSFVQHLAVLGPAGLAALVWLATTALRLGSRGAAAGLAGVLVGALTQDVIGDLEVARACWTWLALGVVLPLEVRTR